MALPYTGAVEGSLWLFVWALPRLPWAYPACSIGSQGEKLLNFQILHHGIAPMLPHASFTGHQRHGNGLWKSKPFAV